MTTWCGQAPGPALWTAAPGVPDLSQQWWLPGPEPMLSLPKVLGPECQWDGHRDDVGWWGRCGGQRGYDGACEPPVPLPVQAGGPCVEWQSGGDQQRHLTLQDIPDHLAQLWEHGQGKLAGVPRRLGHRRGRQVCGKQENEGLVQVVDDCPPPPMELIYYGVKPEYWCLTTWTWGWCCHVPSQGSSSWTIWRQAWVPSARWGGHAGCAQGQGGHLRAAAPAEVVGCFRGLVPTGPHGPRAAMDAPFTSQIPTKILIGLVSYRAFIGAWRRNSINFPHMYINSACLVVVNGWPLKAQPLQLDLERGSYTEAYHAMILSSRI